VLSAFRPATVLKDWIRGSAEGELVRRALVTLQFAAMIVLLIAAAVVFQQNEYATTQALRINTDQMLFVRMPKCSDDFRTRIAALPGVAGAACSGIRVLPESFSSHLASPFRGGQGVTLSTVAVGPGLFELYGLKPVAGRFFRENGDTVPDNAAYGETAHYVINEAAVRQLGYASPQAAIGQPLNFPGQRAPNPGDPPKIMTLQGTIIGVVKDFAFTPNDNSTNGDNLIPATAYSAGAAEINELPNPELLHVKLRGRDIPETLTAIDAAWRKSGSLDPINRTFLDAYVQNREIAILRQGEAFAAFAAIAMVLACLGLFGVSLFAAARRTKEIGIRKAMGASDGDILVLLLWQFGKPVLWANLIAWPLAWWTMNRWLSNFAYHIDLNVWLFAAASAVTLLIALAALLGQALAVARQKAVTALRYE
jgi:putative ABC transport system permease protein